MTGTHALKVGFNDTWGGRHATYDSPADVGLTYRFNTVNGVTTPNLITEYATPYSNSENLKANLGLYAQDKWTLKQLTLNLGVRFDYFNDYFPESSLGPGPLVPNRNLTFPESSFVSWKDVSPRLGMAYDLFGNGKTALKVSLDKYMVAQGLQGIYGDQADPIGRLANMVTRSWNDFLFPVGDPRRGNFVPDCSLTNPLAERRMRDHVEHRASAARFRRPPTTSRRSSAGAFVPTAGSSRRACSTKLVPRVSVNVGYFRRWYGNFTVTDNLAVGADRLQSRSASPRRSIRACRAAAAT